MFRQLIPGAVLAATLVVSSRYAHADLSRNVISAFKGQLVVTKDDLPEGKNDKDTIAKIKATNLKELQGSPKGDVTAWHFHYTAFLTKTGATKLKIEFMNGNKLAADQQITEVDPKSSV